jgi:phage baseplate assembly protein gpV
VAFLAAASTKFVHFVWEEMMISRTWSRKSIAFCVAVAVLSVYSMVTLAAAPQKASGELSVSGQVTVNGQAAISGATIFTDSVITTAAGSNAVVSLGKLGRVELYPNSSIKLSFTEGNISGNLEAGRVQVSTLAGNSAIVTAKDGAAVADASQASTFMVDLECGNMVVASQAGKVELRAGGAAKAVAAGTSESAGTPQPGTRCTRLTKPDSFGHLSGGALAALLLAAGGAVAAAIFASQHDDTFNFGGSVTVVSPTR